jgi:hypothetical protein
MGLLYLFASRRKPLRFLVDAGGPSAGAFTRCACHLSSIGHAANEAASSSDPAPRILPVEGLSGRLGSERQPSGMLQGVVRAWRAHLCTPDCWITIERRSFENGTAFSAVAPSWRLARPPAFDRALHNEALRQDCFQADMRSPQTPPHEVHFCARNETVLTALWKRGEWTTYVAPRSPHRRGGGFCMLAC